MMAALLGEGAGDLDATAFAEEGEALAAWLGIGAGRDSVDVSAQVLTEHRDAGLGAAAQRAGRAPLRPRRGGAGCAAQMLSSARAAETDPEAIAGRAFYADAFPGHPYALPTDGTPESLAALDVAALRAARERDAGARPAAGRGRRRHHRRRARAASRPALRRAAGDRAAAAAGRRCRRRRGR